MTAEPKLFIAESSLAGVAVAGAGLLTHDPLDIVTFGNGYAVVPPHGKPALQLFCGDTAPVQKSDALFLPSTL